MKKRQSPRTLDDQLRTGMRRAQTWLQGGDSTVERVAAAIEARIPSDSKHPNAIEAREYAAAARSAGNAEKARVLIARAEDQAKEFERRRTHQINAKAPRRRLASDGARDSGHGSITSIAQDLALRKDSLGDCLQVSELWPLLFSELDDMGLSPSEVDEDDSELRRYTYDKDDYGERAEIKFKSFKVMLSQARSPKRKSS